MKKMMNLQRLEEVRSNLSNLVSIASIIGPHEDISAAVEVQLGKIGAFRLSVLPVKEPELPPPAPTPVPAPKPEPVRHNHPTRVILARGLCPACDEYHARHVPVRQPEKFEIPAPPARSRKVSASLTYNPERYVPYRVLWAKVIIRAAYDYALWKDSKDLRLRKFAQDAERWLFESSDIELSFENICFAFDFPVERIRAKTRALTKADVKKLEFRERQGRVDPGELTSGNDE